MIRWTEDLALVSLAPQTAMRKMGCNDLPIHASRIGARLQDQRKVFSG